MWVYAKKKKRLRYPKSLRFCTLQCKHISFKLKVEKMLRILSTWKYFRFYENKRKILAQDLGAIMSRLKYT